MDNAKLNALCSHLEQEVTWVEALNALLLEEKTILETRQFPLLEELASKKQELSGKLEESASKRLALINDNIDQTAAAALKDFLKECSPSEAQRVTTLNSKLVDCLAICRELNTVNGQVIANNMYVRQEIINTLSGNKPDAVSVYNSHGDLSSSSENRHHEKA
ncbi:MAG: flagellar protein FlgN [Legionella sp.]|nr:flagellar protein FlgN [Legionella sp.]